MVDDKRRSVFPLSLCSISPQHVLYPHLNPWVWDLYLEQRAATLLILHQQPAFQQRNPLADAQ